MPGTYFFFLDFLSFSLSWAAMPASLSCLALILHMGMSASAAAYLTDANMGHIGQPHS